MSKHKFKGCIKYGKITVVCLKFYDLIGAVKYYTFCFNISNKNSNKNQIHFQLLNFDKLISYIGPSIQLLPFPELEYKISLFLDNTFFPGLPYYIPIILRKTAKIRDKYDKLITAYVSSAFPKQFYCSLETLLAERKNVPPWSLLLIKQKNPCILLYLSLIFQIQCIIYDILSANMKILKNKKYEFE